MADFIAHIANLLIIGDKFDKDGSSYIELKLGERQIKVIQNSDFGIISKNLESCHGRLINTTKVIVKDVETSELEDVSSLIKSLCCLLSFITCSQVVFHSQEYPKSSSSWAIVGKTSIYHNVFYIRAGEVIADFIHTVWNRFISIEKDRRLDIIFDYIHHALYPGPTVESKLLFSFITLESLKFSFAKTKNYPFKKKYFRKLDGEKFSFNELLEQMFTEVGITFPNIKMIKDLRDEIIHSGISNHDFNYNYRVYIETQNLIREYLIKLLGYSNDFRKI